ncbi:unnamed protein product [Orchesella dallaii]|uniref:Uncharacterized protein n=1 Tax=Orchesella dallaii TaxID=48710 RepID=A0ABP1PS64_9HEXA
MQLKGMKRNIFIFHVVAVAVLWLVIAAIGVSEACEFTIPRRIRTNQSCDQVPVVDLIENLQEGLKLRRGIKVVNESSTIVKTLPGIRIIQRTQFSNQTPTLTFDYPGFLPTVVEAYNNHLYLIIRPDDIWAAIMTQFSFYINKNAEKYRSKFVKMETQREPVIETLKTLQTVSYSSLINAMEDEINKKIADPDVRKWILPNFSTTTAYHQVAVGAMFMTSIKKFFKYKFKISCGIPFIFIKGEVEDWKNILWRLEKLKEYDLHPWYDLLHPIMKKFVAAKKGKNHPKFWRAIFDRHAGAGVSYISGWITAFCVFDSEGNWHRRWIPGGPWRNSITKMAQVKSNRLGAVPIGNEDGQKWLSNPAKWPQIDMIDLPGSVVEINLKFGDNGRK